MSEQKRVIAIHLPQFHPTKENNEWWGKGFTEWRNVAKARPRFKGHYQPHLPADLGFYDLRLPEVRIQQTELAKQYGISNFCYYHYWFSGKKLLELPIEDMLKSEHPDFPYMLCWANENWTRSRDGGNKKILIAQKYSSEDHIAHINYLIPFFKDPRYIRIDGKPVFAIYNTQSIPDVEEAISIWKAEAAKEGLELYICKFESFSSYGKTYIKPGVDASIDFQPISKSRRDFMHKRDFSKGVRILKHFFMRKDTNLILSYRKYVDFMLNYTLPAPYKHPCITPMWDNSARRETAFFAFKDSTPTLYQKWLYSTIKKFHPYSRRKSDFCQCME